MDCPYDGLTGHSECARKKNCTGMWEKKLHCMPRRTAIWTSCNSKIAVRMINGDCIWLKRRKRIFFLYIKGNSVLHQVIPPIWNCTLKIYLILWFWEAIKPLSINNFIWLFTLSVVENFLSTLIDDKHYIK